MYFYYAIIEGFNTKNLGYVSEHPKRADRVVAFDAKKSRVFFKHVSTFAVRSRGSQVGRVASKLAMSYKVATSLLHVLY